jgi:hypothetical protein
MQILTLFALFLFETLQHNFFFTSSSSAGHIRGEWRLPLAPEQSIRQPIVLSLGMQGL